MGVNKKTKQAKFSEKGIFLTLRTSTCVYQRVRNVQFFRKVWLALFSYNIRFEICPFALLLTNKWLLCSGDT